MSANRPLTKRMADAMARGAPHALFVSIEHPTETVYLSTSIGSHDWNGHTWKGVGRLGNVTPVKQSSSIEVQDISFRLSGVDADLVGGLADDVHNRTGQVWLACFDENGRVVPDPYKLVNAELDFQTWELADDGTATIEIIAHTGFYVLDRSIDEAWTPENQRLAFPDDTGLDMIPSLAHQDLLWLPAA